MNLLNARRIVALGGVACALAAVSRTTPSQGASGINQALAAQNLAEEHPSKLVQWLFYSHPPLRERIVAAQSFENRERTSAWQTARAQGAGSGPPAGLISAACSIFATALTTAA